ncbi:helix-turn-helix domain-containing protein [Anaerovorax odorimutans]|uniref:helix-turn-helix domain-containing protein n=1 Tax=Anaerovorax odorimutans TaxID=109327 RepID=UPI000688D825|nr:helix-turn-helix domain-containing protein [Anaerovorax odorimutans]
MLLNEKVSIIRKMNNLTQESFAEELAVSRQAVSKWEKGDSVPDVQMITKIADNYNITLDQLVRDEYDLPGMKELSTDIEKEEKETPIQIERYIGKICDVSMNSFSSTKILLVKKYKDFNCFESMVKL